MSNVFSDYVAPAPENAEALPTPKSYGLWDYYYATKKNNEYTYNISAVESLIADKLQERSTGLKEAGIEPAGNVENYEGLQATEEQIYRINTLRAQHNEPLIQTLDGIVEGIGDDYRGMLGDMAADSNGILKRYTVGLAGSVAAEIGDFFSKPQLASRAAIAVGLTVGGGVVGGPVGIAVGAGALGGVQAGIRQSNENRALEVLGLPQRSVWNAAATGAVGSLAFAGVAAGIGLGAGALKRSARAVPNKKFVKALNTADAELRNTMYETASSLMDEAYVSPVAKAGVWGESPSTNFLYSAAEVANIVGGRVEQEFLQSKFLEALRIGGGEGGSSVIRNYLKGAIEQIEGRGEPGGGQAFKSAIGDLDRPELVHWGYGSGGVTASVEGWLRKSAGVDVLEGYGLKAFERLGNREFVLERLQDVDLTGMLNEAGNQITMSSLEQFSTKEIITILRKAGYTAKYRDRLSPAIKSDLVNRLAPNAKNIYQAQVLNLQHRVGVVSEVHRILRSAHSQTDAVNKVYTYAGHFAQLTRDHYSAGLKGIDDAMKMPGGTKFTPEIKSDWYRAVLGTKTGNRTSQTFAAVFRHSADYYASELEKRGVLVHKMKHYHHNAWDLRRIAEDPKAFRSFLEKNADWKAMAMREGRHLDPAYVSKQITDKLVKKEEILVDMRGHISGAHDTTQNSLRGSRFILWKEGASYQSAMEQFGVTSDPIELMEMYARSMSGKLARLEVTGGTSFKTLWDDFVVPTASGINKNLNWGQLTEKVRNNVVPLLDLRVGDMELGRVARMIETASSINVARIVGKAGMTMFFGDKGTMFLAYAASDVRNAFVESLKFPLKALSKEDARTLGVIYDVADKYADITQRDMLSKAGTNIINAGRKISLSDFVGHRQRQTTVITLQKALAELVDRPFSELGPTMQKQMTDYGLSAAKWDKLKKFKFKFEGMELLNPKDVKKRAGSAAELDAGVRLSNWMNDLMDMATPGSSFKGKVNSLYPHIMRAAANGEFAQMKTLQSLTMFWQTAWSEYNAIYKLLDMHRRQGNYGIMTTFLVEKMVGGAMRTYLGDMVSGRTPDLEDPAFWQRSLNFSGALGPFGEFIGELLMAAYEGKGADAVLARAAGPIVGSVTYGTYNIGAMASGNVDAKEARSNMTRAAVGAINLTERMPVTGLIINKLVFEEVYKALDPEAYEYYYKRKNNAHKRDIKYWWHEGDRKPGGGG